MHGVLYNIVRHERAVAGLLISELDWVKSSVDRKKGGLKSLRVLRLPLQSASRLAEQTLLQREKLLLRHSLCIWLCPCSFLLISGVPPMDSPSETV